MRRSIWFSWKSWIEEPCHSKPWNMLDLSNLVGFRFPAQTNAWKTNSSCIFWTANNLHFFFETTSKLCCSSFAETIYTCKGTRACEPSRDFFVKTSPLGPQEETSEAFCEDEAWLGLTFLGRCRRCAARTHRLMMNSQFDFKCWEAPVLWWEGHANTCKQLCKEI